MSQTKGESVLSKPHPLILPTQTGDEVEVTVSGIDVEEDVPYSFIMVSKILITFYRFNFSTLQL